VSHPFNYRANGTALAPTYCDNARLMEGVAGKRAQLLETAYKHGVYVADRHWTKARLMRLDTLIPGGTPAQIFTAKQGLEGLLLTGNPLLARNDPVHGEVECSVLVMDPVEQPAGNQRFHWRWPMWQLDGYWRDATESTETDAGLGASATLTTLAIGGNHPTSPKFTITCTAAGDDPTIEDPTTGDIIALPGTYATNDVIVVDVPNRLVTLNGTRAKSLYKPNRGYWMEFDPADADPALDFTSASGTWTVVSAWKDRYRG
jgi:hypothetical protein